jgi:hypothetical protein
MPALRLIFDETPPLAPGARKAPRFLGPRRNRDESCRLQ